MLMSQSPVDDQTNYFYMYQHSTGQIVAQAGDGDGSFAISSTSNTSGTWAHACAVFSSSTLRAAYLNGGGKGTNTDSRTPPGLNRTVIGARYLSGGGKDFFTNGDICDAAIWDIALSDSEVASLASGTSPLSIQASNLKAYWKLCGDASPEPDASGNGQDLTVTGATQSSNPPLLASRCAAASAGILRQMMQQHGG
jgi:hypothetical protein